MAQPDEHNPLRAIPPVDEILDAPAIADLRRRHPRFPWTRLVRGVVAALREAGREGGKVVPLARKGALERVPDTVWSLAPWWPAPSRRR